ncbi:MAG: prepilin-type N-terminal cleavage/methylation domain-containing protein [Thermodesulfobacteriota bacterium]
MRGFTLLEILVAMAILALAVPVMLGNVSQDIALAGEGKFLLTASLLAQEKMTELTTGTPPGTGSQQGDFGDGYAGYSWRLDVREVELPGERTRGVALHRLDLRVESRHGRGLPYSLRRYLLAGRGE